ncbi:MAG: triose-phosphate isomerase [Phycisphaerales bacterium]
MTDPARTPYVGGNWKMNTDRAGARALAQDVCSRLEGVRNVEVALFVPFPYLLVVRSVLDEAGVDVRLGAQDVSDQDNGAFTGEVSAQMLLDCGVSVVLTGHSERRHVIGEADAVVAAKTMHALARGLDVVVCVGETLEQREAGQTDQTNARQVRAALGEVGADLLPRVTIAYEPVWAIGTGRTATPDDAQDAQAKIRALVGSMHGARAAGAMRIMYGGSMKPANAAELLARPDVDGGLIGGASLEGEGFAAIVRAAAES